MINYEADVMASATVVLYCSYLHIMLSYLVIFLARSFSGVSLYSPRDVIKWCVCHVSMEKQTETDRQRERER